MLIAEADARIGGRYRVPLAELYQPNVPILTRIEQSDASVLALLDDDALS